MWLTIWILAAYGMSQILVYGSIFESMRQGIHKWGNDEFAPFQGIVKTLFPYQVLRNILKFHIEKLINKNDKKQEDIDYILENIPRSGFHLLLKSPTLKSPA